MTDPAQVWDQLAAVAAIAAAVITVPSVWFAARTYKAGIRLQNLDTIERVTRELALLQGRLGEAWRRRPHAEGDYADARTDLLNYLNVVAMGIEKRLYLTDSRAFVEHALLSNIAALEHISALGGIELELHSDETWEQLIAVAKRNRPRIDKMKRQMQAGQ